MVILGVILARAGSKGLPDKCVRDLLGRPVIIYTFDHARSSRRLTARALSTDCARAMPLGRQAGFEVIERPADLATDTARVDAAARHAVQEWERRHGRHADCVVLLYGNVPVRTDGLIDRAIEHLIRTGADSVRSVAPVGKHHPDWLHRLDGDRLVPYCANHSAPPHVIEAGTHSKRPRRADRRQDLEPLYYHDGAVIAVTREALFNASSASDDPHAFFGRDCRGIVVRPEDAVDVDEPIDLQLAEAILRVRNRDRESRPVLPPPSRTPACGRAGDVQAVRIGPRRVGPGRPTFIIAEGGVNHGGCVERAIKLVDAAAGAGADAVKFQLFRAADLVTVQAATAEYQRGVCGTASQREMLERLELAPEAFDAIRRRCAQRCILFLATPFGVAEVEWLRQRNACAIKIASTDLTNLRLLDAAAATGAPLIVSTGASDGEEIAAAYERLDRAKAVNRLILLHCVSCYPAPVEAVNLRAIRTLERTFGVPCGLSDHTTSTQTGGWAVAVGACVVEKHLTLDRAAGGPDDAMSLDPQQFAAYVRNVRRVEHALGTGALKMHECESEVRRIARRSIVAAADIPAGTRIAPEMITARRPASGIAASAMDGVIGRRAKRDIPRDEMLSWEMVE